MSEAYSPGRRVDKAIEDGWKKQVQRVIAHVDLDDEPGDEGWSVGEPDSDGCWHPWEAFWRSVFTQ